MTSASFTESELTKSIAPIERINGVRGVCLSRRSTLLLNRMALPGEHFNRLSVVMDEMISCYEQQGRLVDEIVLGFNGGNVVLIALKEYRLLVLHSDPEDTDEVCHYGRYFLDDLDRIEHGQAPKPSKPQAISRSDVQFQLPEVWHPPTLTGGQLTAPSPEFHPSAVERTPQPTAEPAPILDSSASALTWDQYRQSLTRILGKVMSRQAATLFLNQELTTKRAVYGEQPSPPQFEEVGFAVTQKIPDRVKRERIRSEISDLFEHPKL